MSKPFLAGFVVVALLPLQAMAASPIDGTWKIDMSTAKLPSKPRVILLKDGVYSCTSCTPPYKVVADGSDQKVTGTPYADTIAVKVVDDHTVTKTNKKAGRVTNVATLTVAADGKTATYSDTDTTNAGAPPANEEGTLTRVGKAPAAGAHAVSGAWQTTKITNASDSETLLTYKTDGDSISYSAPGGGAYTATLGGLDAPLTGDPGVNTVSLKKLSASSFQETDKRDGKPIYVSKITVSPDGKTMTIVFTNKERGATWTFTAMKQS